jgi:hypothetical protein
VGRLRAALRLTGSRRYYYLVIPSYLALESGERTLFTRITARYPPRQRSRWQKGKRHGRATGFARQGSDWLLRDFHARYLRWILQRWIRDYVDRCVCLSLWADVPTVGSSGMPYLYDFHNGMTLKISVKRQYFPDGSEFEGVGIRPDIEVRPSIDDLKNGRDPILEKALELAAKP